MSRLQGGEKQREVKNDSCLFLGAGVKCIYEESIMAYLHSLSTDLQRKISALA